MPKFMYWLLALLFLFIGSMSLLEGKLTGVVWYVLVVVLWINYKDKYKEIM